MTAFIGMSGDMHAITTTPLVSLRAAYIWGLILMRTNQNYKSDDHLFESFVTPALYTYFRVKCPDVESGELKIRLTELVKFLLLAHEFPGNILFGEDLDDLWHLWIMQTREYEKLCRALPSGRFMHHDSRDQPADSVTWPEVETLAERMIAEKAEKGPARAGADFSAERVRQNAERLLSFFASYIENFGVLQSSVVHCWPPVQRLLRRMRWSVEDFNAFITQHSEPAPAPQRIDAPDAVAA